MQSKNIEDVSPLAALLLYWHGAKYVRSQQNALESDLLCLPPEILEMIVSYVLGANGTVIHIKYVDVDSVDSYTDADGPPPPLGFHREVCKATKTEHAAYAEANCKGRCVHRYQRQGHYIERSFGRHLYCSCSDLTDLNAGTKSLHHELFASCRRLYHLANTTLYARKPLSFDDALSFSQFMAELDVNQKRMIKSLHLSRPSWCLSSHPSDRSAWMKALDPSSIRLLEGLRTLHLCVDMNISYDLGPWSMDSPYDPRFLESDLEPFLQLRVLPLKEVTVIINDDVPSYGMGTPYVQWTVAEKREWAEKTRLQLLEPCVDDGAGKGMTMTKRVKKTLSKAWLTQVRTL